MLARSGAVAKKLKNKFRLRPSKTRTSGGEKPMMFVVGPPSQNGAEDLSAEWQSRRAYVHIDVRPSASSKEQEVFTARMNALAKR